MLAFDYYQVFRYTNVVLYGSYIRYTLNKKTNIKVNKMKIVVIDGQGGRIGKEIIEKLIAAKKDKEIEIIAVGTNSMATGAMMKAGAKHCATGENPVVFVCKTADIIVGPVGIISANSLIGEITPKMALAVSKSEALKVLIPINKCNTIIAGVQNLSLSDYIDNAVDIVLGR